MAEAVQAYETVGQALDKIMEPKPPKEPEVEQPKPPPLRPQSGAPLSLKRTDVQLAEFTRNAWSAVVPKEVEIEHLTLSDLWSVVAESFHRRDVVHVERTDGAWWAEVLVRDAGRGWANMVVLRSVALPPLHHGTEGCPVGHSVEFLGANQLWGVFRGSQLLQDGFPAKGDALAWITNHSSLR